jgi:hypothetical protein
VAPNEGLQISAEDKTKQQPSPSISPSHREEKQSSSLRIEPAISNASPEKTAEGSPVPTITTSLSTSQQLRAEGAPLSPTGAEEGGLRALRRQKLGKDCMALGLIRHDMYKGFSDFDCLILLVCS